MPECLNDISSPFRAYVLDIACTRAANAISKRGRSAGRVGERKPVRDPVGGAYA